MYNLTVVSVIPSYAPDWKPCFATMIPKLAPASCTSILNDWTIALGTSLFQYLHGLIAQFFEKIANLFLQVVPICNHRYRREHSFLSCYSASRKYILGPSAANARSLLLLQILKVKDGAVPSAIDDRCRVINGIFPVKTSTRRARMRFGAAHRLVLHARQARLQPSAIQ